MAKSKRKKMGSDELIAICKSEYTNADDFNGVLDEARRKNVSYYLGLPMGDEVDGRSKVVSSDVADVVEGMMPPLMRIFSQSEDAVEFEPELYDTEGADMATKYVRHIFFKDNPGFQIVHDQIKDGLMQKMGVVRWRWCETKETTEKSYSGLSVDELAIVLEGLEGPEKTIEIVESEMEEGELGPVYEVKVRVTVEKKRVVIENVPPENVRIRSDLAEFNNDTGYVGFLCRDTRSNLIVRGFPEDVVNELPAYGDDNDQEEDARFGDLGGVDRDLSSSGDKSSQEVEIIEQFIKVDYDGDGVAERRLVIMGGGKLLYNERHDTLDAALFSPIRIPHRAIGRCPADQAKSIQEVRTAVQRNMLDNMYLVNNGRVVARVDGSNGVNLDDLLTVRPGGVVRTKGQPGADVVPLVTPWVGDKALAIDEYMKSSRQERTGVTNFTMGLDGNDLHDTATGFAGLQERSDERIELIARIYAETSLKRIFMGVLSTVAHHQDGAREIRILGRPVEVDPAAWTEQYGVTVNVGLGTGRKDKQIQALVAIIEKQELLMQAGSPLVDLEKYHNALSMLIEKTDLYDADLFFHNPASEEFRAKMLQAAQQQGEKPLDPYVEAEMIKAQSREKEAAAKLQLQAQAQQHEQAMKEGDRMLTHQEKMTELELRYNRNVPGSVV